jgi:hypothetical protein
MAAKKASQESFEDRERIFFRLCENSSGGEWTSRFHSRADQKGNAPFKSGRRSLEPVDISSILWDYPVSEPRFVISCPDIIANRAKFVFWQLATI